jgi:hypothetical protein
VSVNYNPIGLIPDASVAVKLGPTEQSIKLIETRLVESKQTPDKLTQLLNLAAPEKFESFEFFSVESNSTDTEAVARTLSSPGYSQGYTLVVCLSGVFAVIQDGGAVKLAPGDMALLDSRFPCAPIGPDNGAYMVLSIPRKTWDTHAPPPVLKHNVAFRGDRTITRLVRALVLELARASKVVA